MEQLSLEQNLDRGKISQLSFCFSNVCGMLKSALGALEDHQSCFYSDRDCTSIGFLLRSKQVLETTDCG